MSFFSSESTGRASQNIDEILRKNLEATMKEKGEQVGTIGPVEEPVISDEDILDMAMGSGSALKLLRPAIGRVVTNLVKPQSYSAKQKLDMIKDAYLKAAGPPRGAPSDGPVKAKYPLKGIYGLLKNIVKDKPIYKLQADTAPREVPYRQMFDLPPRHSQPAYTNMDELIKQNKSGSFDIVNKTSFNPNTVMGNKQLRDVAQQIYYPSGPKGTRAHSVMGNFGSKGDKYWDKWDFDFNPGEFKELLGLSRDLKSIGSSKNKDLIGTLVLRKLASSITNPTMIKGKIPKHISDDVIEYFENNAFSGK